MPLQHCATSRASAGRRSRASLHAGRGCPGRRACRHRRGRGLRAARAVRRRSRRAAVRAAGRFANATGFRFREIALDGDWWREEGPPFLAVEAASARPLAVVWRRRGWRTVDPASRAETAIDAAMAASLLPRGYMIYAALPERVTIDVLRRFAIVGARGDLARLLIAAAAATLAGLLTPVATGAILGIAVPDGRMSLLQRHAAAAGRCGRRQHGLPDRAGLALIRFSTTVNRRLQAAVWDRVMRLRTSFFRRYSVGDLAQRIVGIDDIRRLVSGLTVNSTIAGVFSLAGLGRDGDLRPGADGVRPRLRRRRRRPAVRAGPRADAARAHRLQAARRRHRPAGRDPGRHRQAQDRRGRAARLLALVARLRAATHQLGPLRPAGRLPDDCGHLPADRWARSASSPSPPAASSPSMWPRSPPSTAPSASSPPPSSALPSRSAARSRRCRCSPGCAPCSRHHWRSRRSRVDPGRLGGQLAVRNLSFRYGDNGPVDPRGCRLRGSPRREPRHRRRVGLGQVDAAAPAARLRDADARRRLLRRQGSRKARPAPGAPPDRHGAGDRPAWCPVRSTRTSPASRRSRAIG